MKDSLLEVRLNVFINLKKAAKMHELTIRLDDYWRSEKASYQKQNFLKIRLNIIFI